MDETGLRQQLEDLHPASFGWALACCARDQTEAEDVLQTVYLKILQGRARYEGRASFRTWLFAVIRRTAADQRRRHWLRRLRLTAYQQEQRTASRGVSPTLGEAMDRSERLEAFQAAFGRLPCRQREILHLVFYQELSIQEAAGIMNVSLGSARTHYERGKARLRSWLTQEDPFDEPRVRRRETPAALS